MIKQLLTVRSRSLDGKAARSEAVDTNVPVTTLRISDRNSGINGESGVQVIPTRSVRHWPQ